MLAYTYLCAMFIMMTYLNTIEAIPAPSADLETQNNKLSEAIMLEQFGMGTHPFLINRQFDNENINDDESLHQKRALKRKWSLFNQGPHSAYTIAFPALIRSRRQSE